MKSAKLLQDVLRYLLALLLLWAAISKLARPTDFLASLYAYQLPLPRDLLKFAAVVLPWTELLCGLLLLGRVWVETALTVTAALFVLFVLSTGQAWARHLDISCGCFDFGIFGLDARTSGAVRFLESVGFAFIRNLALTAAAVFLLWKEFTGTGARSEAQPAGRVIAEAPRRA